MVKGGWAKHSLGSGGAPEVQKKKIKPLRQGYRACSPSQGGEEPNLGEGVGQGSGKAPPHHALAGFSPIALHGPILMSSTTALWKASSWNTGTDVVMRHFPTERGETQEADLV